MHRTSIFGLWAAKTKIGKGEPHPSTPNFDSLPYPKVGWSFFFSLKWPQRMIPLLAAAFGGRNKRFSGLEKILKGCGPPSVDEGIWVPRWILQSQEILQKRYKFHPYFTSFPINISTSFVHWLGPMFCLELKIQNCAEFFVFLHPKRLSSAR